MNWNDEEWEDLPEEPEDVGYVECQNCGEEIYEESEQCPYCGFYVVRGSSSPFSGKPGWYVALALLGIFAVLTMMLAN